MSKYTYLTQQGYNKIVAELEELKTDGRQEVAQAIAEAREKGDLSENAEYDAAKDAQGMLEMKINELEMALANARIIDESQIDTSKVTVLSKVKIKNLTINKELEYQLVSPSESNLKEKKLSVQSPIGEGLLGKKVGDVVTVQTPNGEIKFEVLKIGLG